MRFPFMLRIYLCLRLQPNYELETNYRGGIEEDEEEDGGHSIS